MSFFRGAKKLMVGVGVAGGCAGLAMHMLVGTETNTRVAQASTLTENNSKIFDHLTKNVHEFCSSVSQSHWDFDWDKRDPASLVKPLRNPAPSEEELKKQGEKLEKARPHASRNLILIRHGQYNLNGSCDEERKLTSLGQEQAEFTGLRLKELSLPFSKIIQSSMTRAKETASIISKHLPDLEIQSCDFLREGSPIKPVPESPHWRPQAKQFHEDGARIEAAFRRYFHRASPSQTEDSYEILACHANVIRYFICRALQFPPEAWLRFSLHNCSITWIAIRPSGRVVVYSVGDIGHMPPSALTTT